MSSFPNPVVGSTGLTVPQYTDIYDYLIAQYQAVYGQNVYLGNDSPDQQLISIFALALADAYNTLQLDFNNHSPNFATGAALSSLVKLNGLTRQVASASTCAVQLTGVAGTVVTNGIVVDVNGNSWALPSSVTIGGGGTVVVTATCTVVGNINASIGQLTTIGTPTNGWTSVTNTVAATPGQPVEADSQLRTRQALSTELPSISLIAGTIAGIAAVLGVTRYEVDENTTGTTNGNGTPGHSIQPIVEGGTNLAVATSIYTNKSIGCGTYGGSYSPQAVPVTDPVTGVVTTINFGRPQYLPIYVIVNAHLLTGGTSATITAIQTAIVNYLNSLQIGEIISYGALVATAMSVNANLSVPIVSVHSLFFATTPAPTTITDITPSFGQVSQGVTANVTVNSV
jgi:uncharacterized phage protein gp47/JayE